MATSPSASNNKVKATVVFYGEDSLHVGQQGQQPTSSLPSHTADLDLAQGMTKIFTSICDQFSISQTDRDQYILQLESTKQYLDKEPLFLSCLQASTPGKAVGLILRKKPSVRAQECVNSLSIDDSAKEKDIVFQMRYALSDSHFAESFIDKGGVAALLRMVTRAKGNAQTYALHALRQCMEYVSGMSVVMGTPHLVKELFTLVDSSVVGVVRTALELLFVMCGYAKESGFISVHRAAKATAKASGKEPYANVVNILGNSQDLETMANAFTLLNALLMTCPSEAKAAKLGKQWEKCGLHDKLRALVDIQHQTFQVQLEIFEETTGVNLRSRASRLDAQCRALKAKLREYEQQQALVLILRDELRRLQHFVAEAWADGTLVSSAPMKRYLGPTQPEYPADLSFLKTTIIEREKVADMSAAKEKLNEELSALQSQYTQAVEQLSTMRSQLDTLQETASQLTIAQAQLEVARAATADVTIQAEKEKKDLQLVVDLERALKTKLEAALTEIATEKKTLLEERDTLLGSIQQQQQQHQQQLQQHLQQYQLQQQQQLQFHQQQQQQLQQQLQLQQEQQQQLQQQLEQQLQQHQQQISQYQQQVLQHQQQEQQLQLLLQSQKLQQQQQQQQDQVQQQQQGHNQGEQQLRQQIEQQQLQSQQQLLQHQQLQLQVQQQLQQLQQQKQLEQQQLQQIEQLRQQLLEQQQQQQQQQLSQQQLQQQLQQKQQLLEQQHSQQQSEQQQLVLQQQIKQLQQQNQQLQQQLQ